jgi:uncharacterized protein YjbI with pentapeptide repeats
VLRRQDYDAFLSIPTKNHCCSLLELVNVLKSYVGDTINPMETEFIDIKFTNRNELPESFSNVLFENCSFKGCDMKDVNFAHSRLVGCHFKNCDLSNVNLSNARFRDVHFEDCKMLGLKWGLLDDLTNPLFKRCNLRYGNLSGLKLRKSNFIECFLEEVDFAQSDISDCDFSGSDFLNARFDNTNMMKANFGKATNYQIDPIRNKVQGAKFSLPGAVGLLTGLGVDILED